MPAKRVTIDLNSAQSLEVDRLLAITGLTTADLFRYSITLLRIYAVAKAKGKEVRLVDPKDPMLQTIIELPFPTHQ